MPSKLATIIALLEENNCTLALQYCLDWSKENPLESEAYHLQGLILARQHQFKHALSAFQKAVDLNPKEAVYHANLSNAYKRIGNIALCKVHLSEALKLNPNYAEAFSNLGALHYSEGNIKKAIDVLKKAIRINPNHWEAHFNLAHCYAKEDGCLAAIPHYEMVLRQKPHHPIAIHNLGIAYFAAGEFEKALPLLKKVIKTDPHNTSILYQLAHAYLTLGNAEEAEKTFEKMLELTPDDPESFHNLGVLYLKKDYKEKALTCFEKSIQLNPKNETAQHMITALSKKNSFDTMDKETPKIYISDLFDQYSIYYDNHVKSKLKYNVPALLRDAASSYISPGTRSCQVLDLGCGTGLCGIYFRDLAYSLVGVDLSIGMLKKAKELTAYDQLCVLDFRESIPGQGQHYFDYIVAADSLVYHGNLNSIFKNVSTALKLTGHFLFTVETSDVLSYKMESSGRFTHSKDYISSELSNFGFKIAQKKSIVLRENKGIPIEGHLFVAKIDAFIKN